MNPQLTELAVKAQVEHCVSHVRLQEFADLLVYKVLEVVRDADTRDLVYTTFDKSMVEGTLQRVEREVLKTFNLTKKYGNPPVL